MSRQSQPSFVLQISPFCPLSTSKVPTPFVNNRCLPPPPSSLTLCTKQAKQLPDLLCKQELSTERLPRRGARWKGKGGGGRGRGPEECENKKKGGRREEFYFSTDNQLLPDWVSQLVIGGKRRRARHFWYFLSCSLMKNDFLHF